MTNEVRSSKDLLISKAIDKIAKNTKPKLNNSSYDKDHSYSKILQKQRLFAIVKTLKDDKQ